MSTRRYYWLFPLLATVLACPATTSNRSGRSYSSEDGDEEGEGGDGGGDDGDGNDDGEGEERVKLKYKSLSDAVKENSSSGRPRKDARRLRERLCEGNEDAQKIFYHLIVSSHYHYYWICSDENPRRTSTKSGKKSLKTWLRNLQRQAQSESRTCAPGSSSKILTGHRHESGIEGTAYCDGRIVLSYPDGTSNRLTFQTEAGGGGGEEGGGGGEEGGGGGETGTKTRNCPPCTNVTTRGKCPDCPRCEVCPPPKPCPPKDCSKEKVDAGRLGFRQGIDKACKRICDLIYKKCRSIDPKTAMCYTMSSHCADECAK